MGNLQYYSPNSIQEKKTKQNVNAYDMGGTYGVSRTREMSNAHKILVGKSERATEKT
jgi:hypothetical protein